MTIDAIKTQVRPNHPMLAPGNESCSQQEWRAPLLCEVGFGRAWLAMPDRGRSSSRGGTRERRDTQRVLSGCCIALSLTVGGEQDDLVGVIGMFQEVNVPVYFDWQVS